MFLDHLKPCYCISIGLHFFSSENTLKILTDIPKDETRNYYDFVVEGLDEFKGNRVGTII